MFDKKNFIVNAAFTLASTFSILFIINYYETNPSVIQVNNAVLTAQTVQIGQAPVSETIETNLDTLTDTEADKSSKEDTEVNIITYTVKSGDTLDSIASTYNLKVKTIAESNSISTNSLLKEGQVLELPSVDGVLYKIKSGETLWDLALLNNVDFNKIVEVNKLEAPDKLKLNQKIFIPGVEAVKPATSKTNSSNKLVAVANKPVSRGGSIPAANNSNFSLPVKGQITSKFGPRWGKQHTGLDIAAPTGTSVYAAMDGTVSFSGWDGGYGKLVIIDHENGLQSYYAHNSELLVEKGQTVGKGDRISKVGSTGDSTGPHSHFEIRENGNPVNPYNYVR